MSQIFAAIKEHYKFSPRETRELLMSVVLVAFMFAFDDKAETFSLAHWGLNYFNTFLIVLLTFLIGISASKIWGLMVGYRMRYKMWSYGLALGVAAAILSKGSIIMPLPGGFSVSVIPRIRIGGFRYGLNYPLIGWINALWPLASILTAMFVKFFFSQLLGLANPLIDKLVFTHFIMAFFLMLPIPPMPGLMLFFGNRMLYAISFSFLLAYVILFVIGVYSLIIAVIIAVIVWASYYLLVEYDWGPI